MIDTHCHIYLDDFEDDIDDVLQRAADSGVQKICMPAITFDSLQQMDQLTHDDLRFYKMAGLHPCEVEELPGNLENDLHALCSSDEIIAVGETGLDYHWSTEYVDQQKKSLSLHCEVAKSIGKPIVLHNRESTEDVLDIIEEHQDGTLDGIWHCFNGSVEEGLRAIDLGLMLGIGGVVTFKNAGVDLSVAKLPVERMVLETDAPYLSPAPMRGKRNEPSFMKYTAQKLADLNYCSVNEIVELTTKNAENLFGIG